MLKLFPSTSPPSTQYLYFKNQESPSKQADQSQLLQSALNSDISGFRVAHQVEVYGTKVQGMKKKYCTEYLPLF